MKIAKKQVRIIKKIREASGIWRFISLQRAGSRYVWDDRHGYYFLDWREGRVRKRECAGSTPAEATEAQGDLLRRVTASNVLAPTKMRIADCDGRHPGRGRASPARTG